MTEINHCAKLSVVGQGEQAGKWQQLLVAELVRTHNFTSEPAQADALVVVIGPSFSDSMDSASVDENGCIKTICNALDHGKKLLPVMVGGATLPRESLLPKVICAINEFQALTLDREASVPSIASKLVLAVKPASQRYVSEGRRECRVFISYRRDDCWYWASLLRAALALRIGPQNVFFDISSIEPGQDFDNEIKSSIRNSTDFVILVGSNFLICDEAGYRRIDRPEDFVRREIQIALYNRKTIHIIHIGDAALPNIAQLPADIAPAFRGSVLHHLDDYTTIGAIADNIVMHNLQAKWFKPVGKSIGLIQAAPDRSMTAAIPRLAEHGWRPMDSAERKGTLVMTRSGANTFRFVIDLINFKLTLEEHASTWKSLGLKRWIKRKSFLLVLDDIDSDPIAQSDGLIEALANPSAYLDRIGRYDYDDLPISLPKAQRQLRALSAMVRANSQPGHRALDQYARESARIRAKDGLPELPRISRVMLGENATAQDVAFNAFTGCFLVASSSGIYSIDVHGLCAERFRYRSDLTLIAISNQGQLAVASRSNRLWILSHDGKEIAKGKTPYSLWQQFREPERQFFSTLSWREDGTCIAIGAYDSIWIYHLNSSSFEQIKLRDDMCMWKGASALFIPDSDDLILMQRYMIWRMSKATGQIGPQLDLATGSDLYDQHSDGINWGDDCHSMGFAPECIAISNDSDHLAVGGNDAQLVLLDGASLKPLTMRVWHHPLVNPEKNGSVEALAFSPDGHLLASVANDNRLVVGDVQTGDPLAEAKLSIEAVRPYSRLKHRVCWSTDCAQIGVTNGEGGVEIFGVRY
jgi:hypothetical protein